MSVTLQEIFLKFQQSLRSEKLLISRDIVKKVRSLQI